MHQLLSYQTAMRAANERDVREYITRRICISFVFSIGFFTLIAGFLLGKFVSDRQYLIKQIREETDLTSLKQLELSMKMIMPTAQNVTLYQSRLFQPDTNTKLWDSFKACLVLSRNVGYDLTVNDFVSNVVETHVKMLNRCILSMDYLLNHSDD